MSLLGFRPRYESFQHCLGEYMRCLSVHPGARDVAHLGPVEVIRWFLRWLEASADWVMVVSALSVLATQLAGGERHPPPVGRPHPAIGKQRRTSAAQTSSDCRQRCSGCYAVATFHFMKQ